MKKYIALILVFVCLLSLFGCAKEQKDSMDTSAVTTVKTADTTGIFDDPDSAYVYPSDTFEITMSRYGYSDSDQIYFGALNRDKMYMSSVHHLPVYKCDTAEELDAFNDTYSPLIQDSLHLDEVPQYRDVITGYDGNFFDENSLVIVYLTSGSGSLTYGVESIFCDGKTFVVHVERTNDPECGTDDMVGWLIAVAVPDSMIEGCGEIDADFVGVKYANTNMFLLPEKMPDDFNFSITWGCFGQSSYDSKTGKLVKTTNATDPRKYVTYYRLSKAEKEQIYKYIRDLDPASYPTAYDPHEGKLGSDPSMTIILTVRKGIAMRSIVAENIAITYEAENEKGQAFLTACKAVVDVLTETDAWKKLPDYEFYYD